VQAQLVEPVIDEVAAGFGRQTSTPIRFSDVKGEYRFVVASPTPIETAITDVPRFRLEDRCHEAYLMIRILQVDLAELTLSVCAAPGCSTNMPAEVRISFDFAIIIEIRRLMRSEQESFRFERHREAPRVKLAGRQRTAARRCAREQ